MRPNELINTNDTSLKLQRTSQRNSFNPRNVSHSHLLPPQWFVFIYFINNDCKDDGVDLDDVIDRKLCI